MENLKANTPPPLSAEMERPDKNDAVEHFMTRYAKMILFINSDIVCTFPVAKIVHFKTLSA